MNSRFFWILVCPAFAATSLITVVSTPVYAFKDCDSAVTKASMKIQYSYSVGIAIAEKLGDDLADKVFEIATLLKQHPSGDFGVAYLMRRLEKS